MMPIPVVAITAGISAFGVLGKAMLDNDAKKREADAKKREAEATEFVALAGVAVAALGIVGIAIKTYGEYKTRQLTAAAASISDAAARSTSQSRNAQAPAN